MTKSETAVVAKALPGGAWLIPQKRFSDARGHSLEVYDAGALSSVPYDYEFVQENTIFTEQAGVLRGLHYQAAPFGQAKLTYTIAGMAQFFWIDVVDDLPVGRAIHSVVLGPGDGLLLTPASFAHGFMAVEPNTTFSMKTSQAVNHEARRQIAFQSGLECEFQVTPRFDLLSERDRAV